MPSCSSNSLLFPIDVRALLLVTAVALLLGGIRIFFRKGSVFARPPCLTTRTWLAISVIALLIAYNASLPSRNYDTNLYHLNVLKWANNYPAVPGIVNLHERLAFNNSFHLFAALTNLALWNGRAVHIAGSFLLFLVSLKWFFTLALLPATEPKLARAFAVLTAPFVLLLIFGPDVASLSTDLPLALFVLVFASELICLGTANRSDLAMDGGPISGKNLPSWLVIVSLAAVAISTKLSGMPVVGITLMVAFLLLFRHGVKAGRFSLRLALVTCGLPALLVLGFMCRSAILSGWLIYPFPVGNLHFDWSVSADQVRQEIELVQSWARMPWERPEKVLNGGFVAWFVPWLKEFRQNYIALTLLAMGATGLGCLLCRAMRPSRQAGGITLVLPIATGSLGLAYWFVAAPSYRFGEGYFWVFAAASFAPLLCLTEHRYAPGGWLPIVVMALFVHLQIIQPGGYPTPFTAAPDFLHLPPSTSRDVVPVLVDNGQKPPLVVYRPKQGDQCGDSPIPCSPYIQANSSIALRVPGELGSGFRRIEAQSRAGW